MPRPLAVRLTAGTLALLVALAAPGGALAHGEAHHREDEHARDHQRTHVAAAEHGAEAAISAPDHEHEHQHPRLDSATRTRTDAPGLVARPGAVVAIQVLIVVAAESTVRREVLPPGDPHTGPPPRLRAPPAR